MAGGEYVTLYLINMVMSLYALLYTSYFIIVFSDKTQ